MWEALFVEYRSFVQSGVFVALAAYALLRGDMPEKLAASVFVGAVLLDNVYHAAFPDGSTYDSINIGHLVLDCFMLVALAYLGLRANRIYPLWLLAAQLISTAMHLHRAFVPEIHPFAYWALTRVPSYLQMFVLLAGIAAHHRRTRRGMVVRPWRVSSKRS